MISLVLGSRTRASLIICVPPDELGNLLHGKPLTIRPEEMAEILPVLAAADKVELMLVSMDQVRFLDYVAELDPAAAEALRRAAEANAPGSFDVGRTRVKTTNQRPPAPRGRAARRAHGSERLH